VSDLRSLLDELADTVAAARTMPMSSSVIVHRDEVLDLLQRAREALPGELEHADAVLAQRDLVLERARQEADHIVAAARARADELVADQAVVAAAAARAERLVADARAEAQRLLAEADDYCDRRLADFEIDLQKVAAQVARGRDRLRTRAGTAVPPDLADSTGAAEPDPAG
jgi:cell division septum initiation protein DivIVA